MTLDLARIERLAQEPLDGPPLDRQTAGRAIAVLARGATPKLPSASAAA